MRIIFRWVSIVILVVTAGLWESHAARAAQEGIQIVSSDSSGMILELELPAFTLENVQEPSGLYQQIKLAGWASTTEPDMPQLPVRAALIQVPVSGGISFDILEDEQEAVNGLRICPVPDLRSIGEAEAKAAPVSRKSEAEYGSSEFFPKARVQISERQFVREDCLARVAICPFQFNPATGELRISKRMRISVRFESALPLSAEGRAGDEVFSKILSRTVPNYAKRESEALPQAVESAESSPAAGQPFPTAGSSGKSLRIEIQQEGIYRITYEQLLAQKLRPSSIDPASLRMLNMGSEIAIKVVSDHPYRLSPGDTIEFYARGMNDSYTSTNVYWLTWGEGAGKRIESTNGRVSGTAEQIDAFSADVHFEENHVIWSFTPGAPDVDPWFWEKLTAPAARDYSIQVSSVRPKQSQTMLQVALRGGTTMAPHPDHHTQILLNGVQIGNATWDGDIEYVHSMSIPAGLLKEGKNTVRLVMPGDTGAAVDAVLLNWIEAHYTRLLEAENDSLFFHVTGKGKRKMAIGNFHRPNVRIFDITDPTGPREVVGASVKRVGRVYTATFQDSVDGGKSYFILNRNMVGEPHGLSVWKPANLADSQNGSDYILITSRSFLDSVAPLLQWHKSRGMRVKGIAVEDIYNEFNYGIFHPSAIKRFLQTAFTTWKKPAPTYVLLVGDATGDYRGYLGAAKKNIVPPHLSITEGLGLTPDDGWYASVAGDDPLPDMLIGRLSAASPEAAAQVSAKVVAYEKASAYKPKKALFIADNDESGFETINEKLITTLPAGISSRRVYLSKAESPESARSAIMNGINSGMLITNYVGHGNAFYWAAEKIFQASDVALLKNKGKLTFVTSLDCYDGFFSHPSQYSLGELFVITPGKGAIGSFAPSGTGYSWEHSMLGKALFSAIFKDGDTVLGSFTTKAKIEAFAQGVTTDLIESYSLMGDPASRLKLVK